MQTSSQASKRPTTHSHTAPVFHRLASIISISHNLLLLLIFNKDFSASINKRLFISKNNNNINNNCISIKYGQPATTTTTTEQLIIKSIKPMSINRIKHVAISNSRSQRLSTITMINQCLPLFTRNSRRVEM